MPEYPTLAPAVAAPLSAILLARGELPLVEETVGRWVAYLDGLGRPYELLVADDAAEDRTEALTTALSARFPKVRVLRDAARRGEGAALRAGLAAAQYPLLFYTTCDRQFRPDDFQLLLDEIDKVHIVCGCRAATPVPAGLRVLGAVYRGFIRVLFGVPLDPLPGWLGWRGQRLRWLARLAFGVRLSDPACPFRLLRREVFHRVPIQSDGPFAHVEIMAKANFLGQLITEVPIPNDLAACPAPLPATAKDRAEARAVFAHPDFGPAVLPDEAKAQTTS